MSTGKAATFSAGLIQMRSGLTPQANLDAAVQADRRGQERRRRLCADARDDQHHGGQARAAVRRDRAGGKRREPRRLPRARAQARHLPARRLARHQAVAGQGGQPLVPDRPQGRDRRALRQDPHVRRRSRQRRELSRVAQLPSRRDRRRRRPALGPARAHGLLRPALPRALPRAGRGRRSFLAIPSAFTRQTGEAHWHVLNPRPRHRERRFRAGGRAGRHARERPRDLRPFAGGRSLGPHPRRRRHRAGRDPGRDRSGRGRRGARESPVAAARPALRDRSSRWRSRRICMRCEARHDPLRARLRQRHEFESWFTELRRLRQAGQARPRHLPGLRLDQGREGDHGAALGRGTKKRGDAPPRQPAPEHAPRRPRRPERQRRSRWCRRRSASSAPSSRNCATT